MNALGSCLVVTSLVLAAAGCGGFYRPAEVHPQASATNPAPPQPYLTLSLYFRDTALSDPAFRAERDGELARLLVTMEIDHPDVGGHREVPLYLLDLDAGQTESTQGAELISRLPFRPEQRDPPQVKLWTRALERSKLGIVDKIWGAAKGLATGAAAANPEAGAALALASGLIDDLAASKAFEASVTQAVPKLDGDQAVQAFLIVPTQRDNTYLPRWLNETTRTDLAVCHLGGAPALCVGKEEYRTAPYVLLEWRLSSFVDDPDLLPTELGASCDSITPERVSSAKVAVLRKERQFSPTQAALEADLNGRAELLLRVRAAVETRGSDLVALEAYSEFLMQRAPENNALFQEKYKKRFDGVQGCVDSLIQRVPGKEQLKLAIQVVAEEDPPNATQDQLEQRLRGLGPLLALAKDPDYKFLDGSTLLKRVRSRLAYIEELIYTTWYRPLIQKLEGFSQENDESKSLAVNLRNLMTTQCDRCREGALASVRAYQSRVKASDSEQRVTSLVAEASTLRARVDQEAEARKIAEKKADDLIATRERLKDALAQATSDAPHSADALRDATIAGYKSLSVAAARTAEPK